MNWWNPPNWWKGKTVYIVGGGPSLCGVNLTPLKGKCVIGCNDAYVLGEKLVPICYFGDYAWWMIHRERLKLYEGILVSCSLKYIEDPSVHMLERVNGKTLEKFPKVGWFCNTGASAINLAVNLGAKKIVLLGFDMKLGNSGQSNWHINEKDRPKAMRYQVFMENIANLADSLWRDYPEVEVINANMDSALNLFRKVRLETILEKPI
jgi:hypothetical protein